MDVKQTDNGKKGTFFIEIDGQVRAKMTYVWSGEDRIIIDHTEVENELRGTGAGKQLVLKAVDFAREKKLRILPLCPFAKSVFDKVPEIQDLL